MTVVEAGGDRAGSTGLDVGAGYGDNEESSNDLKEEGSSSGDDAGSSSCHSGEEDDTEEGEEDEMALREPTGSTAASAAARILRGNGCSCHFECKRPAVCPIQPCAKVFVCASTECSRALAVAVKQAAEGTSRIHGYSTAGTPWLYARRVAALKEHNMLFLRWCRQWIREVYGVCETSIYSARTEPHIVKYRGSSSSKFKGIGTHQDGSFVTCIMALSDSSEYCGGGTYFAHLDRTVNLEQAPALKTPALQGEVLLFQGKDGPFGAPHRAQPIASGKRILYIAFFNLLEGRQKLRWPAAGSKKSARAAGAGKRTKSRVRKKELKSNAEIDQGETHQVGSGLGTHTVVSHDTAGKVRAK